MNPTPNSAQLSNLNLKRWNAFSQAPTATYTPIAATFVPNTVALNFITAPGVNGIPGVTSYTYRFAVTSGNLPAWIVVGAAVTVAASVTVTSASYNLSRLYQVLAVDPSGLWFDVAAPSTDLVIAAVANALPASSATLTSSQTGQLSLTPTVAASLNPTVLAATAVDSATGWVPSPQVSLSLHMQKAMIQASSGTVQLAPVVDAAGNAPYSITVTGGSAGEYELTDLDGDKTDLSTWQVKYVSSGTLAVRFK